MFQQKKHAVSEEDKNKTSVEVLTFFGIGTEFRGKVVFQGTLRVDGSIEGQIEGSDTLILGETGSVTGECNVLRVIVSGQFRGEIYAGERVVLKKNANVNGKIVTPSLVIEEGALFNGSTKMGADVQAVRRETEQPQESSGPMIKV